jgi:hypothetical protein
MVYTPRGLLILAGLAGLFWPTAGFGQSAPSADTANETIPTPRVLEATPAASPSDSAAFLPAMPPPGPAPGGGSAFPEGGILVPPGQTTGWFANIEIGLLDPHINSHLNSGSNIKTPFLTPSTPSGSVQTPVAPGSSASVINLFGNTITLPIAPLDWAGAPRLRLGYRLADGAGDVQLDWRMLASQGTDVLPGFDAAGDGVLRSRVNVQQAKLTYGSSEFLTNAPNLNRTWAVRYGVSAADIFFDSQAHGQQILEQRASSNFAGVGLALAFQWNKPIRQTGFGLYGELDASGLVGWTRQRFSETIATTDVGPLSSSANLKLQSNGIAIFGVEGGFSYDPWQDRTWRFTLGYLWQRFWWVGATNDSNANLTLQGIFFRGEWRY